MADSKDNIRAMLTAVRAERKQISERDDMLEEREETLIEWLKEEEPQQGSLMPSSSYAGPTPLAALVNSVLADGKKHSTQELAMIADKDGLISKKKSQLRVMNAMLQSYFRIGVVGRTNDGLWVKK